MHIIILCESENKIYFMFYRRNKVMNHFTLMLQKRLKNEEDEGDLDEDDKTKGKKGTKSRKKGLKN